MKEIKGNFWDEAPNYQLLCVTTNGVVNKYQDHFRLVMGAGIARQFRDRYPLLPRFLGFHVRTQGNKPRLTKFVDQPDVISLPTKEHFKDPSTLELVGKSAKIVEKMVSHFGYTSVLSVQPGCGLGGLDWEDVKALLESLGWDDRFTIISPKRSFMRGRRNG